jgi:TBC1 domain-containing protein 4
VFYVLQVVELFNAMRDQSKEGNSVAPNNGRSLSSAAALTSLCADISPSSSHFFEVSMLMLLFNF